MAGHPVNRADANTQYEQVYETYREIKRAQGRVVWVFLVVNAVLLASAKYLLFDQQSKLAWVGACIVGTASCFVVMSQTLTHHNLILDFRKRIAALEGLDDQEDRCSLASADELVGPLSFRRWGWYIAGIGAMFWVIALIVGVAR